jgi:hypothetical protein
LEETMSDHPRDTDSDRRTEPTDGAFVDRLAAAGAQSLRGLGELTQALLDATTIDGVLQRIIVAARYLVPGADMVSITLRQPNGQYYTPVNTEAEAVELDHVQYETGQGPCLDAAAPDGPAYAHSGDLAHESSWPAFAHEAAEHGYASILSTALVTTPESLPFTGALNIYSREANRLNGPARDTAFILATHASLALNAAYKGASVEHALKKSQAQVTHLRKALDTRTVIGQAIGILMARRQLTADEAFHVLSRASQDHNIKVARLAETLAQHPETGDRI